MSGLAVVVAALATVTVALAVALVVVTVLWRRTRRRVAELEQAQRTDPNGTVEKATRVVRGVVRQAYRLREHGVTGLLSLNVEDLLQWADVGRARITEVAGRDGIVTIFFSDIADSTALNERLGDADWVLVLRDHDQLVTRRIERAGGTVVKTMGDGVMAVFPTAGAAVGAATAIHGDLRRPRERRLRRTRLSVRVGIHTGTAVSRGEDYLGRNVVLAARLAAHAGPGQTLVSDETRLAVDTDVAFRAVGPMTFKGITGPTEVFAVEVDTQEPAAGVPSGT